MESAVAIIARSEDDRSTSRIWQIGCTKNDVRGRTWYELYEVVQLDRRIRGGLRRSIDRSVLHSPITNRGSVASQSIKRRKE